MLRWALDRARSLAPLENIVTVVAEEHRSWWKPELEALPGANVIIQPRNKGTAAGILLPLITVLRRDPRAMVVVLPSDHYVEDEETLACAIARAAVAVASWPDRLVLLGMTPAEIDTEYGWILPARGRGAVRAVERFVEKPSASLAAELMRQGALWNSFIFVASAGALLRRYGETLAEVLEPFLRDLVVMPRPGAMRELYAQVPAKDFSRELLQRVADRLDLVVVPPCGWSDLGTPTRLGRFLQATSRPSLVPSA